MKAKARRRAAQLKPIPLHSQVLPDRWRGLATGIALLILTLLAFSNSFQAGFALDNKGLLHDPRLVQATSRNIGLILHHSYWWPNGEAGLYRPLTTLSYLFNYAILGNVGQPAGYHWLNFVLHAINVLLVYALLLRLTRQLWASGLIAAAWAVHPLLTESVTNIVGRADLLAGAATLGGFLLYLKSAEAAGWRRAAWLAALMAITFAGVFSKESAVCIIGVIVLCEAIYWKGQARVSAFFAGCAAVAVPIGVMLYQRSKVLAASLPAEFPFTDNPIVGANFYIGRLTAFKVIARYLWLLVWPAKLSSDYSYSEIPLVRGTLSDWFCCIALLSAIVLAGYIYKRNSAYKQNRAAFFLACFAGVTFFPMSNLALPIGTIMAERFMYLPAIGLIACLVLAIYWACDCFSDRFFDVKRLAPAVVCLMIVCFAIRTWGRNADWQDELSIVTASLDASPDSYKLHRQMAALLYGAERTPENIRRGKEEAEKSVALIDALPDVQNTAEPFCLAGAYDFMEAELLNNEPNNDPSRESGSVASASPPGNAEYQRGIARVQRCAQIDKAVHEAYVARLATVSPRMLAPEGDPQPYLMLSAVYARLNDPDKAVDAAREALRLHPRSSAGYLQVANVFMRKNLREDAARALTEGILLTSGSGLAEGLAILYRGAPGSANCNVMQTATGDTMNPQCAPFRQRVCALSAEVLKVHMQMSRRDLAEQQRLDFTQNYGCPPAPLDSVLSRGR